MANGQWQCVDRRVPDLKGFELKGDSWSTNSLDKLKKHVTPHQKLEAGIPQPLWLSEATASAK